MSRFLLALAAAIVAAAPAFAQDPDSTSAPVDSSVVSGVGDDLPPETEPIDVRVLRSFYNADNPAYTGTMEVANWTAYPVYWSASPVAWTTTLATDADIKPALRLTLSQLANYGATFAIKNLVRRPRPYVSLEDVDARDRQHQGDRVFDPNSFPSGHTSSAFVIATSLSASFPEWYVIAPSYAWATAVGVSRMYLGVHYPSDVLIGAGLGTATALLVYLVIPEGSDDPGANAAPIVSFRIPL